MFRILDRYLGRQILVSTFFAVAVLSVVLVLGQIFKRLLDSLVAGVLPASAILKFIGYSFPWSLSYTIPWGMLTAVLLTFGRLSADNELIALRMSGLSLRRICMPVFAVSLAACGLCFWINTSVAPRAYLEVRRTTHEAVLRDPGSLFKGDKIVTELPGFVFYAEEKEGETMKNLLTFMLQQDRNSERARPVQFIFSKEGGLSGKDVMKTRELGLDLRDNIVVNRSLPPEKSRKELDKLSEEEREEYRRAQQAVNEGPPVVSALSTKDSPTAMPLTRVFEKNAKLRVDGLTMSELLTGIRDREALMVDGAIPPSRTEMLTEFNRRLSFSMACFVLALVGIPFGITAQRRETSVGFVMSLAVGISYFALIMLGGLWQDRTEKMPHLWMWLPNVVFGGLGLVMFRRLQKR